MITAAGGIPRSFFHTLSSFSRTPKEAGGKDSQSALLGPPRAEYFPITQFHLFLSCRHHTKKNTLNNQPLWCICAPNFARFKERKKLVYFTAEFRASQRQLFSLALGNKIIDLLYGRPRTRVTRSSFFPPRGQRLVFPRCFDHNMQTSTVITFRVHFLNAALCVAGGFLDSTHHPPDVPPRNHPSMNRLNGRSTTGLNPDGDFEPSCLVRTPSGNVYIPTGEISVYATCSARPSCGKPNYAATPLKKKSQASCDYGFIVMNETNEYLRLQTP